MNKLSDIEKDVLVEEAKSAGFLFFDKDKNRLWTPEDKIKDFLCFIEDFAKKTVNDKGKLLEFRNFKRIYLVPHNPNMTVARCIKNFKISGLFEKYFDSNLVLSFDHKAGHYLVLGKNNTRYWVKEHFFKP
jgi:hypothetical protein